MPATLGPHRAAVAIVASLAAFLVALAPAPAGAQQAGAQQAGAQQAGDAPGRELVVVTRVAPPFAMKTEDGAWEGISIDLWRHLAEHLHLRYRLAERADVPALLHAVTSGEADLALGALTVTGERRKIMDFTQPFFTTGLGVAVPRNGLTAWLPVLRSLLSVRFLQAVLGLLGTALLVGTLIWIFERHENEHYGGGALRGFVAGAWWSAVAMTQAGAAQHGPRSTPGRVLAVVWMVASVITIAVFIAGVTSALTTQRLQGIVRNANDLRGLRVGAVRGTATVDYLTEERLGFRLYPTAAAGLRAAEAGDIDAFVYDRPLLAWSLREDFPRLDLAAVTLDRQGYAIALPLGSPLREPLDVALLDTLHTEWWKETLFRHLGRDGGGE
ncbi:MAG: transporter substrate-binding domain-containing protein [Alphaproteobacteria bacterium]|nr:transporter substrate-binding domain-containing protein [Alphaproteobacteria bacterium]